MIIQFYGLTFLTVSTGGWDFLCILLVFMALSMLLFYLCLSESFYPFILVGVFVCVCLSVSLSLYVNIYISVCVTVNMFVRCDCESVKICSLCVCEDVCVLVCMWISVHVL